LTQFQFLSSNGVYSVAKYATVRTQGKDLLGMQTGIEIPLNPGNINLEREKDRDRERETQQREIAKWKVGQLVAKGRNQITISICDAY